MVKYNNWLMIRPANIRDAIALSQVIQLCIEVSHSKHYLAEEIKVWKKAYTPKAVNSLFDMERDIFLLRAGNMAVGTIQFDRSCHEIKGFYVHPAFQQQGYGSILLQFLLGQLKAAGVDYVELSSNPFFKSFYEQFSFQVIRLEQVNWGGFNFQEFRMGKRLDKGSINEVG